MSETTSAGVRKWACQLPVEADAPVELVDLMRTAIADDCIRGAEGAGYRPIAEPVVTLHEPVMPFVYVDEATGESFTDDRRLLVATVRAVKR